MNKNKLFLIIMALSYSIVLGSFVYIFPKYKELFIFLQIVTLPAIYAIGFEILMDKQKEGFEKDYIDLNDEVELQKENLKKSIGHIKASLEKLLIKQKINLKRLEKNIEKIK